MEHTKLIAEVAVTEHPPGFFQGTEMPTAGWWEALWPDPAGVLTAVGLRSGMDAIDLCSGDGWFTLQMAKVAQHVSAIDIDPTLLEVARHRLVESRVAIHHCSVDIARGLVLLFGIGAMAVLSENYIQSRFAS
ncbi:MAG: class I SAM-dependent methyltransferase [Pseudolabrys sp.]